MYIYIYIVYLRKYLSCGDIKYANAQYRLQNTVTAHTIYVYTYTHMIMSMYIVCYQNI